MRQLKITKQVTNRETASLDKYLQEIGKVDLITAEEEVELAQRVKQGDQLALEKLTKANLRFVVSVAKQYQNQGLTLPDLINEGNLGLIKAAQRFDETRGFKFISYAVWWIRQSILQALAEQSRIVRLPLNKIGSINKINKTYAFLEQSHERPPSAEEIANELDMTINDVKESMKNSPNLLKNDIIDFVSKSNLFVPHFHIPLQSGSNKILARMKRRYKKELYEDRINHIHSKIDNCCIGVDVIVGFPCKSKKS